MNGSKLLKKFNIELEMECEKAGIYIEESDLHCNCWFYKFMCPLDGKKLYLERSIRLDQIKSNGSKRLVVDMINDLIKDFKIINM